MAENVFAFLDQEQHIVHEEWDDDEWVCGSCGRPLRHHRTIYLSRPEESPARIHDREPECLLCNGVFAMGIERMRAAGELEEALRDPEFIEMLELQHGPIDKIWYVTAWPGQRPIG